MSLKKTKYAEYIRDFTSLGNPFLLLLVTTIALSVSTTFLFQLLVIIIAFLINECICSGIKYIWHKPRPNQQQFTNAFEKIDAGSFPSIHASRIFLVYTYISYIHWADLGNPLVAYLAIPVILLVGYSRIFLMKHFLFDVLSGYLIGFVQVILLIFYIL